jgi:plasmid stabilization system protein ParE
MPSDDSPPCWLVSVSEAAETDLNEVVDYFLRIGEFDHADTIFNEFENAKKSLETFPLRAHFTEDLKNVGVFSHREVHFFSYRVIFRVDEESKSVFIDAVLDGRRNVEQILMDRSLRVVPNYSEISRDSD